MLRQGLTTIARNAETQRTMVNDVLDVSRIISGKMRLQLEELDLLAVVADAVESMKPALEAKRLYLDLSALAAPATVTGDPDRLRQVIWNLLSNAVKFTPDGGRITLSVVRGEHTLDLQVSDNGLGIRPEFLPYVFDRFSQADRTASRRHAGLGLGLAIVRHLVELHGGQVFVASDGEGKGSTFTVSLPIRAVRQIPTASAEKGDASQGGVRTAVPALSATVLRGVRVLVLDDLEDARAVVAAVLQAAGAHTVVVRSGEEALEALAARPADVVLADIGMPGMDGFEFLRRLRATGNGVPVIALTAYGGAADRTRILAAGFDQHLTKPVLPGELLAGLAKTLEQERAAPR
jgi:CheY-like chemotaxis protein